MQVYDWMTYEKQFFFFYLYIMYIFKQINLFLFLTALFFSLFGKMEIKLYLKWLISVIALVLIY